jgi:hypothetical protein
MDELTENRKKTEKLARGVGKRGGNKRSKVSFVHSDFAVNPMKKQDSGIGGLTLVVHP